MYLKQLNTQQMSESTVSTSSAAPPTTAVKQGTSSSKKKYEYIWKSLLFLILIVAAILFQKVYIFQTHDHFADVRQGNVYDLLFYCLPVAVIYTIVDILIHNSFDPLCEKYYITLERYTEPEQKKKRSYTLVKWGYTTIYYFLSSVWAYKIMIGTEFMPTWLGGRGSPLTLLDNAPRIPEVTLEMKVFYMVQAGKHLSRFFAHIFIKSEGNFFEFALHHGLSVFLILFSYLSNQWTIGIFVLLIHDYSDFALIMARAYKDYRHCVKRVLDAIYVHAFIAWISCRIILFCYCCIYASVYSIANVVGNKLNSFELEVLYFPYCFMSFMMMGLQILHLFWTYYIAESFVSVKISKELAKHTYD